LAFIYILLGTVLSHIGEVWKSEKCEEVRLPFDQYLIGMESLSISKEFQRLLHTFRGYIC